ncbi:MAG: hypothetical protein HY043_13235 [Verrucomicrobia bacterium]|nr:hypothetical protein [Verrucomicrobiota bacterium]
MTLGESPHSRKRLPAKLPELRQRDERLECLLRLAGRLAHDFNNFLVPVLGYAALIREEAAAGSAVAQYAAAVEKSARKTECAIEDMLIAARTQRQFIPRCLDLAQLVEQELKEWKASLPAHAAITVHQTLPACSLAMDETQCRILLKHLLRNARLALATGGDLRIELSPVTFMAEQAEELGMAYREVVLLTVTDTGSGMPPEVLQRAFDPFFTTRRANQALGVGLAVAHAIVRAHGGQIVLDSREDQGATVRIWLPLLQTNEHGETGETKLGARAAERRENSSKLLLIIDDPCLAEAIKGALQRAGLAGHLGRDCQEARKFMQNHPGEIVAVIVDVSAGDESLSSALVQFRELHSTAPFIFIRGDSPLPDGLRALSSEAVNLEIKKPFAMKGLMEMVAKLAR